MTPEAEYEIETNSSRFTVTLSRVQNKDIFLARYWGTTPKVAAYLEPGKDMPMIKDVGQGALFGKDENSLFDECVAEIERIHGEVVSVRKLIP